MVGGGGGGDSIEKAHQGGGIDHHHRYVSPLQQSDEQMENRITVQKLTSPENTLPTQNTTASAQEKQTQQSVLISLFFLF
jgi:hypothetical protein